MVLRQEQLQTLRSASRRDFEARMTTHLKRLFPRHTSSMGPEELGKVIGHGIDRADEHGFRTEIGVCRFVELMCYFGAEFDRDPQAHWAQAFLANAMGTPETERSRALHDEGMREWGRIAGPDNVYLHAALRRLQADPVRLLKAAITPELDSGLAAAFRELYPEKAEAVGGERLGQLVRLAFGRAKSDGFTSELGVALYAGLAFALGCGFAADPFLPWARTVVTDVTIREERPRIALLFEAARAFLARWNR